MNVKDLISLLSKFDETLDITYTDGACSYEIVNVKKVIWMTVLGEEVEAVEIS